MDTGDISISMASQPWPGGEHAGGLHRWRGEGRRPGEPAVLGGVGVGIRGKRRSQQMG